MPRISEFYGIVIAMYFDDHPAPHIHVHYAEHTAKVSIPTGQVVAGDLPVRAARLVREWARLHRAELEANWERARRAEPLVRIEPLP